MNQVNWSLQEEFYFPKSFGVPCSTPRVEVKPQVEFQQSNGVCSLYGVYHIAANVEFQPGECEHHGTSEWISIEDLDLNGESGYFEYAVPLFVELPPTYVHGNVQPEVHLSDVNAYVTEDRTLKVDWNVTCLYQPQPQESSSVESSYLIVLPDADEVPVVDVAVVEAEPVEQVVQVEQTALVEQEEPVVKEDDSLPFFLRDLKDSYSVYEIK